MKNINNYPIERSYLYPLLISSNDDYTNNLERRVLYIGQETNCWMNYDDSTYLPDVDAIEDKYFNFSKRRC